MNKPGNATERGENNTLSILMGKLYFQLIIYQEWIKETRNLFLKDKWDHFTHFFFSWVEMLCGGTSCKRAVSGSDNNPGHPQNLPFLDQCGTFNSTGHIKWEAGYIHLSTEWVGWDELNEALILYMVHFNYVLCFE